MSRRPESIVFATRPLTIVNVAEILIAMKICIYLPSKHQHDEDGDALEFIVGEGKQKKEKENGIFHYASLGVGVVGAVGIEH
jgi:hypothetical protein